jgi:RNA polymerase sigma-70 factor (ECF subfamily)
MQAGPFESKEVVTMSEARAVARVLAGDPEAFAELMERYDGSIRACLRSIVRNQSDVDELDAECWVDIFAKLRTYDPMRDFLKWAKGFARNLGCERLRFRKAQSKLVNIETVPEELLPSVPGPEEIHERRLAEEEALAIVAPLPPGQQSAVYLCVGEGLTAEEVAKLTGRKVKTVESDVHRGLATLRRRMRQ